MSSQCTLAARSAWASAASGARPREVRSTLVRSSTCFARLASAVERVLKGLPNVLFTYQNRDPTCCEDGAVVVVVGLVVVAVVAEPVVGVVAAGVLVAVGVLELGAAVVLDATALVAAGAAPLAVEPLEP